VLNAGIGGGGPLEAREAVRNFDRIIAVNLRGVLLGIRAAVAALCPDKRDHLKARLPLPSARCEGLLPLEQAIVAHQKMEAGEVFGRIVLVP
jgi:NAD(P)-dependent dehydrogenase (short-subunit alcohol dehydrogenase family)